MMQANLQFFSGVTSSWRFSVLACVLVLIVGAAQGQAIVPTEAEQRWIDQMLTYYDDGEHREPLLDDRHLSRVALKPYGLKQSMMNQFEQIDFGWAMLDSMRNAMTDESDITFLRIRQVEGQRKALFRVTDITGLAYIEWFLKQTDDGKVIAWDADSYTAGERFSQSLRRLWIRAVIEFEPEYAKHMGERNRTLVDHFHEITTLREMKDAGEYERAIEIYEAMPDTLKDENICMIHAMTCYSMLERNDDYVALLERYNKLHSGASNQELMAIDLFLLRKKYEKTLQLIDGLDRRVGGDPYLELFRSTVAYEQGDYQKANRLIDQGLAKDARMEDFYWVGLEYAMAEEDWPRVSKMLNGVESIGIELLDLAEVEGYEGYVVTEEYQRWLATRKPAVAE